MPETKSKQQEHLLQKMQNAGLIQSFDLTHPRPSVTWSPKYINELSHLEEAVIEINEFVPLNIREWTLLFEIVLVAPVR